MSNTTTVIQRTPRLTGFKDVIEIPNKRGDTGGRVYTQYPTKLVKYTYKVLGIRGTTGGRFVA